MPLIAEAISQDPITTLESPVDFMPWTRQTPQLLKLKLELITANRDLQCRENTDLECLKEYAAQMKSGCQFPPITVFFDGSRHLLADGFHRTHAAISCGLTEIYAEVHRGNKQQVIAYAASANARHGIRRTNADKQRAVRMLLVDLNLASRSDRFIAQLAAVDHKTVASVRQELAGTGEIPHNDERVGKDGRPVRVKKKEKIPDSAVRLEIPDGFMEAYDAYSMLLKSTDALCKSHGNLLGMGFEREELQALPQKLRAMADQIEKAEPKLSDEKIQKGKEGMRNRKLFDFLIKHSGERVCWVIKAPYRDEQGTWNAEIHIRGHSEEKTYHEKYARWI